MTVRLTQGPPVKGDDFFDREEVIKDIWDKLERSSVLLAAPRKFGKTSIMLNMRDYPKNDFIPIFFDIEHIESPEEFIAELIEEIQKNDTIWKKVKSGIFSIFKTAEQRIEEFDIKVVRLKLRESKSEEWKDLGKQLIKLIITSEKKLLLILDEFPEMIKLMMERDLKNSTNQTRIFLSWFHMVRETIPEDVRLRFIVGGSICLENLLKQIDCIAKISDMRKIKVGPFSDDTATELIRALFAGEGEEIDESISKAILEKIGTPIPFFIQIMVTALVKESRYLNTSLTEEFVGEVYEKYLLGSDYKSYFEHYHLRIGEYYIGIGGTNETIKGAKSILTEISIQGNVPKRELYQLYLEVTKQSKDEDGFGEIISLLEDEFYLEYVPQDGSYRFFSKLLKDWWYRHFGMLKY